MHKIGEIYDAPDMYSHENHGAGAVAGAVAELRAGKTIKFAVCKREPEGTAARPVIVDLMSFAAYPGKACVRYCGQGGLPDEVGSSSLTGSVKLGSDISELDPVEVGVDMAFALRGAPWVFRIRD